MENLSRINDIIVHTQGKKLRFNEYQKSNIIGKKIYDSFIGLWQENGISLDGTKDGKYGTISHIMALSSLLEFNAMGVDISRDIDKFKFLLQAVFEAVYKGRYTIFDASPYYNNVDGKEKIECYVETASKICITMIDLRNYAVNHSIAENEWIGDMTLNRRKIQSYDDLANAAEELLIDSINALTDSCLPTRDNERKYYMIGGKKVERNGLSSVIQYRGWSFQKPDGDAESYGTSIYYTYHATNAYISLYNAYPTILTPDFFESGKIDEETIESLSDAKIEKYNRDLAFIRRNKKDIALFRSMCSSSGRYIDYILKSKEIDISFDYLRTGFSKVSATQILDSQKNNYVMETLFTVAILMNAGIDEDYEFVGQDDYIYNQIMYALTNIKKIYSILRRSKKEDLIDSYMLSSALFSEKFPTRYNDLVQRFRSSCETIVVYDLVPLLCNTYSIIFTFLVKYPQRDMIDNLEMIMENRSQGDNWYWDKDGFSINNNLYYIVALENFYDYYNEYELPFMGLEDKYNLVANEAREELRIKTADYDRAKQRIRELEELYKNKKSSLDSEVERISKNVFDECFKKSLEAYFDQMIDDSIKVLIKYSAGDEKLNSLLETYPNVETLLKLSNAENFMDMLIYNGESDEEEISKTKANISKKIRDNLEFKKSNPNIS